MSDQPAATPEGPAPRDPDPTDPAAPAAPAGLAGVLPVDLRDYVDFSRGAATRVRVLATDRLALDLWCVEPQQATPVLHLEDRDVVYTVLGGRSWVVTDEGEVGLDPLGSVLVPAGVVHGIDNRGADPLIVAAACSPPGTEPPARPVDRGAAAVRTDDDRPGPLRRVLDTVLGDR